MRRVSKSGLQLIRRAIAAGYDPQLSPGGPRSFLNAKRERARRKRKASNA